MAWGMGEWCVAMGPDDISFWFGFGIINIQ